MSNCNAANWLLLGCSIAALGLAGCSKTVEEQAVADQLKIIEEGSFEEYQAAIQVLVEMGAPAVEPLIGGLKSRDAAVKCGSAEALGRIGDGRSVPALIKKLGDDDSFQVVEGMRTIMEYHVCEAAAEALGRIGDPRAIEPLIEMLENSRDPGFKQAAAGGLGNLRAEQAIEPLIEALKEDRFGTNYAADAALSQITGHHAYEEYEPWAQWWEENKHRY